MISSILGAVIGVLVGIAIGGVIAIFALEAIYEFSYQKRKGRGK